jgi:NAD(P)-dependent dehydrogenase (short-subunit alcohol dehydrogenase family)
MTHSLVIGGTRGIGREVVRRLAGEGQAVSVIGRRPPADGEAALANVRHWVVDLLDGAALEAALREILAVGPLRSLVFCQRWRGSGDPWAGELQTSLTLTRALVERLAGAFEPSGDRAIVLVSSVVGHLVASEQEASYHVAKAGMIQLARFYAVRLGPAGIRVNSVSPSVFVKDESRDYYRQNGALVELFSRITPLRRMGTASEIAAAIQFLCSPAASFVTGQDLVVDGGISLQAQPSLARSL